MAISEAGRSDTRPVLDSKPEESAGEKPRDAKTEKIDAALIVFGRDDKGKAHASRFGKDARAAAMKAAHLMGFVSLAVTKDAMRVIAEGLPEGRIFKSGKAFVPFVKEGTCVALEGHAKQFPRDVLVLSKDQIAELEVKLAADDKIAKATAKTGTAAKDKSASDVETSEHDDDTPAKSEPPADWLDVQVGSIVLAVDDPDDGWWEAKVTHAHKSGMGTNMITMLTLEWLAFPDEPSFVRRADEVAYFHPAYGQSENADDGGNSYAKAKGKA